MANFKTIVIEDNGIPKNDVMGLCEFGFCADGLSDTEIAEKIKQENPDVTVFVAPKGNFHQPGQGYEAVMAIGFSPLTDWLTFWEEKRNGLTLEDARKRKAGMANEPVL